MTEKDVITKIILKRGMVVKFKSFFCMVLVLLSCTSMQGIIKFYLKWGKNKFEITEKAVEETKKLKDLFEDLFGNLGKESEDFKGFDKDGNFIFNMKNIAEKIILPNGEKLVDKIIENDVKKLAVFLGKPEEFNFIESQDYVVLCNLSLYLNNEQALKVCYKNFQDRMTDKELLGFLEGKGDFLSYVIGENVIPNDFLMKIWRWYDKEITRMYFLQKPYIKYSKEILFSYELGKSKNFQQKFESERQKVCWKKNSDEEFIFLKKEFLLKKHFIDNRGEDFGYDKSFISKDSNKNFTCENTYKKGEFFSCGPYKEDFCKVIIDGSDVYLTFLLNKKDIIFTKKFNLKFESVVKSCFASPSGTKLFVFSIYRYDDFEKVANISALYIELNVASIHYGNDFAENVVVRGLRLYKKPFVYNPYNKRMKLLSKEMVKQLFEAKLLKKPNREETQKMKIEKKLAISKNSISF